MTRLDHQEVAPGVHRFGDGIVNGYALTDGDEVTLVDALFPNSFDALVDGLDRIGHTPSDVTGVLVTHGHVDHIGTAERWRRDHAAPVLAHGDEVPRLEGRRPGGRPLGLALASLPSLWRPHTWRFLAHGLRHGLLRPEWIGELRTLEDGERLEGPGTPVVVATPGHTEGHVAFHLPDHGAVLSGDALTTVNVLSGQVGPQVEALTVDLPLARASLDRIAALDGEVVLPGHGDPFHGSPRDVRQARERGRHVAQHVHRPEHLTSLAPRAARLVLQPHVQRHAARQPGQVLGRGCSHQQTDEPPHRPITLVGDRRDLVQPPARSRRRRHRVDRPDLGGQPGAISVRGSINMTPPYAWGATPRPSNPPSVEESG